MARLLYGGSGADLIAAVGVGDGDYEPTSAIFNVYTERACTNQHTNLQNVSAGAITQVDPDASGRVMFFGQDGYTGDYYLRDAAAPASEPWLVRPSLLTNRVQTLEAGSGGATWAGVLPAGGIPQADLDAATELKLDNAIPKTVVDVAGDLIVATAADTVGRLARGTALQILRVNAAGTALEYTAPVDTTTFATKTTALGGTNGTLRQFSDVPDAAFVDGEVLISDGSATLAKANLNPIIDAFDPSTDRLVESSMPLYHPSIVVVDAGAPVPSNAPTSSIILRRQAVASIVPTLLDEGSLTNGNNLVLTFPEALASGNKCVLAIGASGEGGVGVAPVSYTFALSGGATATYAEDEEAFQSGSCQSNIIFINPTSAVAAGATLTINANQTATTTDVNRTHLLGALFRSPNLMAGVSFDQSVAAQGASTTGLTKTATTGTTVQSAELAYCAFAFNSGSTGGAPPATRTAAATAPFITLSNQEAETATSGRTLLVAYRILSAIGTVTPSINITTDDSQSGAWAMSVATYRAG